MKYFVGLCICLWSIAVQAAVQVSVRPLTIQEGQSVELVISSDKAQSTAPDWSPLLKDFNIGGQMYAEQTQIINGQAQTRYQFMLPLTPLGSGEIQVPSLTWGTEKTQPVVISVQPIDNKDMQVFMTAQTDKTQVYAGQGVAYTARVYDKVGLSGGEFIAPVIERGEVQKIGDPVTSSETKDGKWYQVYEQKYILFAPKAGTTIITPARFQGYVQEANAPRERRNLLSVFGMPDDVFYRGFIDQQREINLRADPTTLEVLPQPISYKGWWLPASSVSVQETLTPKTTVAQLGDNIALQVVLVAKGVMPHQLPDIDLLDMKGFKIYPGEAQKTLSYDEKELVSTLEKTFVLVPIQNGELTIPPLAVEWFNVNTQKAQTASTQAHTLLVQGSLPPVVSDTPVSTERSAAVPEVSVYAEENSWLWFVGGFCLGLITCIGVGVILFLVKYRRKRLPDLYPY